MTAPSQLETDYLIVGAGATGMAFADTIVAESDAHVTLVDRMGKPGGHWNDAYPFVRLHQPSSYYGVNSAELGSGFKDLVGPNAGMYELASGPEVLGYYDRVMNHALLPSGRVTYLPLSNHVGGGEVESLLSGARTHVTVRRRTVDTTVFSPVIPLTHTPRFPVSEDVELIPPNALPHRWHDSGGAPAPSRFVVIGAGKTAMDTCGWLLAAGADPAAITWVMPRDSWMLSRAIAQNQPDFFHATIGGQADLMETAAAASSADDWFLRLEAAGYMLRLDPSQTPTMFHLATLAPGELEALRRITDVLRLGRVLALEPGAMVLDGGRVPTEPGTLFVDCSAVAFEGRSMTTEPIFQDDRIVPQLVRAPFVSFSSALIAHVELAYDDDATRNRLCAPVAFANTPADFLRLSAENMDNALRWSQDGDLTAWILASRLDIAGRLVMGADFEDPATQALFGRIAAATPPALENLRSLAAAHAA